MLLSNDERINCTIVFLKLTCAAFRNDRMAQLMKKMVAGSITKLKSQKLLSPLSLLNVR
jgi:hypothetical protein